MVIKLPSASAQDRAMNCPASMALPHVKSPPGEAARAGTAGHRFIENAGTMGREAALELVPPQFRKLCEAVDLSALPIDREMFWAEVGLAWDYVTGKGRITGYGENIDFAHSETEFFGIADVLASGSHVYVADYKFGRGFVPRAKRNPQLKTLAVAACAALGKDSAVVEVIAVREDEPTFRDRADLDALDLDEHADRMRSMVARIKTAAETIEAGRRPDVKEGGWCRYCPAWDACPAKIDLLARMVAKEPAAFGPGDLPTAYARWRDLQELEKRAGNRIKDIARREPIELGEGRMYGLRGNAIREYVDNRGTDVTT